MCITKDINGQCSSIGFPVGSMAAALKGTLVVVFDVNFMQAGADANSQTFLSNLIFYLANGGGGILTLPTGTTINQNNVSNSIINQVNLVLNNNGTLPSQFLTLFSLRPAAFCPRSTSSPARPPPAPSRAPSTTQFLTLMLDPFVSGRIGMGGPSGGPMGFACDVGGRRKRLCGHQ
ncbi:MAG TPA: hypothetical protein VGI22_20275 [Xanthobacteraceae bacterium]